VIAPQEKHVVIAPEEKHVVIAPEEKRVVIVKRKYERRWYIGRVDK